MAKQKKESKSKSHQRPAQTQVKEQNSESLNDTKAMAAKEMRSLAKVLKLADYPDKRIFERVSKCCWSLSELYTDVALDIKICKPRHPLSEEKNVTLSRQKPTLSESNADTKLHIGLALAILRKISERRSWPEDCPEKLEGLADLLDDQAEDKPKLIDAGKITSEKPPRKIPAESKLMAVLLAHKDEGWPKSRIAIEAGVSRQTVYDSITFLSAYDIAKQQWRDNRSKNR